MPYTIRKAGNKFEIIRKADNKVVGVSDTLKNAQGSIAHRMSGEGERSNKAKGIIKYE